MNAAVCQPILTEDVNRMESIGGIITWEGKIFYTQIQWNLLNIWSWLSRDIQMTK